MIDPEPEDKEAEALRATWRREREQGADLSEHHAWSNRAAADRDAIVRAAKAAGYRRVNTAAGPVNLDDWQPYGATKGDPRTVIGPMTFKLILDEKDPRIEDVLPDDARRGERLAGVWRLGP